jgi:hypothetical protein
MTVLFPVGCRRFNPLNERARNKPSEVMSRYSISAKNCGSTQVAFRLRIALVSFDFGLTTVSSCLRIWVDTVRDQPGFELKLVQRLMVRFFESFHQSHPVVSKVQPRLFLECALCFFGLQATTSRSFETSSDVLAIGYHGEGSRWAGALSRLSVTGKRPSSGPVMAANGRPGLTFPFQNRPPGIQLGH